MTKSLKAFAKLHWVDIVIFSIVIAVLLSFFFFFYRKATYITIRVKVTNQEVLTAQAEPRNNYAWRFHPGDIERDVLGRVVTEIESVESYAVSTENKVVYLNLRVRATYDTRTQMYAARGKNLMFGTPMRFNLTDVTFDGYVTEVPGATPLNVKEKVVKVKAFAGSIAPSLVKEIKVGDTVTNSLGKELVKITKVDVQPARQVTQDSAGNLRVAINPIYKDVNLEMDLLVKDVNNADIVMFDNYKVNIGTVVPINLRRYNLYPAINDIEGL
jgi:hypothetical protein